MTYRDLIYRILPDAKSMGFVDQETGQVDAAQVELAVLRTVDALADGWDLDANIVIVDNLFVTSLG